MKLKFLIVIVLLNFSSVFSQDDKTVTLTVSAQGATLSEAKQNALRDAIEQAFGTFISSNTEILDDELVKDEIVSVSNGNIQKFEILSEVQIENGEWSTTLKAVVSVTKLTSFCESKGISVEFKGSLFAFNVNQQILNEKNEIKAIEDVCQVIRNIADVSFDYSITASDPISLDASNSKWRIPMYISVYKNSNFDNIPKILYSTLKGISLSLEEAKNYVQLGKNVYPISIASNENDYGYILLRTDASIAQLLETLYYFNHSLQNFNISNGIAGWSIKDNPKNLKYIYDYGFRIFIKKINNGSDSRANCKASVFYTHCSPRFNCNVGMVKELREVRSGNCGFNPGGNPILDYKKWVTTKSIWNGNSYVNTTGIANLGDFQTAITTNRSNVGSWKTSERYFTNQFSFIKNLDNEILNNVSGVVISFIPYNYENSKKKKNINEDKELVRFYYEDIRSLEEINKISEYTVKAVNRSLNLYSSVSSTNNKNQKKSKVSNNNEVSNKSITNSSASNVFKIKIQKNRTNINIRKKPVDGVVISQVSGGELYTVTNESPTDTPIYLLNNDMVLTDFQTGIKIEKPKDFKLSNVRENTNNTYYAELININNTINKVHIEKNKVKIEYNRWYYLEELKGWIYSIFCEKM